jgi:hypothetical protein
MAALDNKTSALHTKVVALDTKTSAPHTKMPALESKPPRKVPFLAF